jgi:hypothetical protein
VKFATGSGRALEKMSVPHASVMNTNSRHLHSKGTGMLDASFAGLLDSHECPICGVGQLIDVADTDDDHLDGSPACICLHCELAVFLDPVLVPAGRASRSSAA